MKLKEILKSGIQTKRNVFEAMLGGCIAFVLDLCHIGVWYFKCVMIWIVLFEVCIWIYDKLK